MERGVINTTITPLHVILSRETVIFKQSLNEQTLSLPVVVKIEGALESSGELVETDCGFGLWFSRPGVGP